MWVMVVIVLMVSLVVMLGVLLCWNVCYSIDSVIVYMDVDSIVWLLIMWKLNCVSLMLYLVYRIFVVLMMFILVVSSMF